MLERLVPATQVLLALVVLIAGYYDIRWRRIPNWLTLPSVLAGFALNAFLAESVWAGLQYAFFGFLLAMAINFPLYALHARGAGDVKLLAAVGAMVGWRDWVAIFIISGLLGGVLAIALMLGKGRFKRTLWNTGYIVAELAHWRAPHMKSEELDVNSPLSFRLPQGAVIALGTYAFLGLHALLP
ncbi:MAG: prepilin peptidase [Acidobacteriota bacterium]